MVIGSVLFMAGNMRRSGQVRCRAAPPLPPHPQGQEPGEGTVPGTGSVEPGTVVAAHIRRVENGMADQPGQPRNGEREQARRTHWNCQEIGKGVVVAYFEEALGEAVAAAGNVMTQAPSRNTRWLTPAARSSLLATLAPPARTVTASTGTVAD